jgi:hypothetical protein
MLRRMILAGIVVGMIAQQARSAPLVYLYLVGRQAGSVASFSRSVQVVPGDTVEYQVLFQMAPLGTSNTQYTSGGIPTTRTLQYWKAARAGGNSMSLDLFQNPNDPVQIDLHPATLNEDPSPQLNDSWASGTGANAGRLVSRAGSQFNDLIGIRPIHAPGVFTGVDVNNSSYLEVVLSGTFTIPQAVSGEGSMVRLRWGTTNTLTSGGFAINGNEPDFFLNSFGVSSNSERSSDPYIAMTLLCRTLQLTP